MAQTRILTLREGKTAVLKTSTRQTVFLPSLQSTSDVAVVFSYKLHRSHCLSSNSLIKYVAMSIGTWSAQYKRNPRTLFGDLQKGIDPSSRASEGCGPFPQSFRRAKPFWQCFGRSRPCLPEGATPSWLPALLPLPAGAKGPKRRPVILLMGSRRELNLGQAGSENLHQ